MRVIALGAMRPCTPSKGSAVIASFTCDGEPEVGGSFQDSGEASPASHG